MNERKLLLYVESRHCRYSVWRLDLKFVCSGPGSAKFLTRIWREILAVKFLVAGHVDFFVHKHGARQENSALHLEDRRLK